MINFFKNLGKGLLYILVLPLLVVALAIYAVVALFIFLFLAIKGLVLFFTGRSLFGDLPEDIEAKKRLGIIKDEPALATSNMTIGQTSDEIMNQPGQKISADPFYVPEYLKPEEESFNDDIQISEPEMQQDSFDEPSFESVSTSETSKDDFDLDSIFSKHEEPISRKEESAIEDQPEETISIEKTPQNAAILDINDIDDEEEDNSGINIDFE